MVLLLLARFVVLMPSMAAQLESVKISHGENEHQEIRTAWTVPEVRAAMLVERQKIRSALVVGKGFERHGTTLNPKAIVEGSSTLNFKFDFLQNCFLMDHSGPYPNTIPADSASEQTHFSRRTIFGSFPQKSIHFSPKNAADTSLIISSPDFKQKIGVSDRFFIDIRALGLSKAPHFFDGLLLEDAMTAFFESHPNFQVVTDSGGKLIMSSHNVEARRMVTLWVDIAQGLTPTQITEGWGKETDDGRYEEAELIADCEVQWRSVDGVFVPISYKHNCKYPYLPFGFPATSDTPLRIERMVYESNYEFRWENLNKGYEESDFDYHDLDLPSDTCVYDDRSGKRVFVERMGSKRVPVLGGAMRGWLTYTVFGCTVLIIILSVVFKFKRKQTGH